MLLKRYKLHSSIFSINQRGIVLKLLLEALQVIKIVDINIMERKISIIAMFSIVEGSYTGKKSK